MENIVPVSDMRSYNQALANVEAGHEVILTKNGRAKYVVSDFEEYQKMKATLTLFEELHKGKQALKDEGAISLNELKARMNEKL
ncbi:type II toxin-antitoxin system prevent-host-death family antitoxin [Enterococcus hulanensis]|uniref:Antitoxin n=1 Tax=Enterococcus hulanensis TaxID=2559929 RepID=A0ABU3EYS2_9ENTE|nr:type II toxin-antitoxin system prevent-host-death family antitoxin [Enterococcus hulanensis]MDT2600026.1 type II toxin-antitoxin system prevent-host-death family antitoxin [Enterococcus hulanensis]MDT2610100.1 type II toxin-antitoxin system prevent-host-death family antitoxin [Enterococcus hulanensis]MDT2617908.1 type II toxin-antitoxin system prevent-host-death family antitoxin [Enterococcus hulanensis]MDT2629878.1 type II toxin-antitoxin system prevent-host-death family antitoxin [Enteroco